MANETEIRFRTTFLLRRGLAEAWTRVNPTLMYGEPGFEKDTNKLKIGNGVDAWNDLAYFGGDYSISADGKSISINQGTLALYGFGDAEAGQVPSKGSDGKIVWVNQSGAAYTAGDNIQIVDNVISATDTVYDDTEVRGLITARKLEVLSVADYGFNTNLRVNQQVDGSALIDKVIEATETDKKQVIIKSGDYEYNVISIVNDESLGIKGFAIATMYIPQSSLNDRPLFEKGIFLYNPTLQKTCSFYTKEQEGSLNNAYNYIKQIGDYLFEVQYSTENIDYDYANDYFKALPANEVVATGGFCTGIYKDQKVLRHLDWFYNNNVEFLVRRPKDEVNGIHASVGMCASVNELTKEVVESGAYNIKYQLVPFVMTDGINDAGLYIQSNVVPSLDGGFDLNPTAEEECCISMALRYMLDHCTSFAEVEEFFNTVHIYSTSAVGDYGYHFLLAQGDAWEVIEITANGHVTVTEGTGTNQMPHGIMTNFRTTGLSFTDDNINWSSVEDYGSGVERYDIATKAFTDDRSFALLQNDLLYTHMYTGATPEWLTELCGETDETYGKLTVMDAVNNPEKFITLMAKEAQAYANRNRKAANPDTWQTTHSAIYDLATKSFTVSIQERLDESFEFFLDENGRYQDKLIAGSNITISSDGKTINAVDTKYTITIDI